MVFSGLTFMLTVSCQNSPSWPEAFSTTLLIDSAKTFAYPSEYPAAKVELRPDSTYYYWHDEVEYYTLDSGTYALLHDMVFFESAIPTADIQHQLYYTGIFTAPAPSDSLNSNQATQQFKVSVTNNIESTLTQVTISVAGHIQHFDQLIQPEESHIFTINLEEEQMITKQDVHVNFHDLNMRYYFKNDTTPTRGLLGFFVLKGTPDLSSLPKTLRNARAVVTDTTLSFTHKDHVGQSTSYQSADWELLPQ